MKNFLYKEFKICMAPVNWLFLAFTVMMIIPNYPCYVPYFYICLSCFFIFSNGELNRDMQYSLVLPIKKSDIVKSRCLLIGTYEILSLILGIVFAVIRIKLIGLENKAGIEPNVAFFGLVLIPMTMFHLVFFPGFYKKGEKPGLPFLFGSIVYFLVYMIVEIPVWISNVVNIEYFTILDQVDLSSQIMQLPVLGAGILIYVLGWIITYKISARNFERVNL